MNPSEMIDELEWFKLDTDKRTCRLPLCLYLHFPQLIWGSFPLEKNSSPKQSGNRQCASFRAFAHNTLRFIQASLKMQFAHVPQT